jgi:hypothetical protein
MIWLVAAAALLVVCVCAPPERVGIGEAVVAAPGGGLQVGSSQACRDQGARELPSSALLAGLLARALEVCS